MKQRFLNQKLGKRMSRKAELQRVRLPTRRDASRVGNPPPRGGSSRPR